MEARRMPVLINPFGTIYNPESIKNTLESIISGKVFGKNDLFCHNGTWLSFAHYTDFSSEDQEFLLKKMNENRSKAEEFLKTAGYLFITFGTSRVYRHKETGKIVSNCHKVPASHFTTELLTKDHIVDSWKELIRKMSDFNSRLKLVFTVSPVRHWKDGAHANQVSKSILFLSIEDLIEGNSSARYFPAYELLMDDLRDYRFYADDMLHPSAQAVEYIWDKFADAYFDKHTRELQKEILRVTKAMNHRFLFDSQKKKREFAENILNLINEIEKRQSEIDLTDEKEYFNSLLR
jgi:hypothetical protein